MTIQYTHSFENVEMPTSFQHMSTGQDMQVGTCIITAGIAAVISSVLSQLFWLRLWSVRVSQICEPCRLGAKGRRVPGRLRAKGLEVS